MDEDEFYQMLEGRRVFSAYRILGWRILRKPIPATIQPRDGEPIEIQILGFSANNNRFLAKYRGHYPETKRSSWLKEPYPSDWIKDELFDGKIMYLRAFRISQIARLGPTCLMNGGDYVTD